MTQVYDPLSHRTVVARPGEVAYKFYAVNKLLSDLDAAGIVDLQPGDDAPADVTKLWLDISSPEIEGGVAKAWNGSSWVLLTPALFCAHITEASDGFVTNAEMAAYVSSLIGSTLQAYDADLTTWAGLSPSANAQSLVTAANYAAMRTLLGLVIGTDVQAYDADLTAWAAVNPSSYSTTAQIAAAYQPLDSDLTAIAALTTTTYGRALLVLADAASGRIAFGVRDVLSANRTYYVRTDGSDSNDGSANTSGAAFLTIQKAIDTVGLLDTSIHDVTISITSGTYTGAVTLKNFVGAGLCTLTCPSGTATISTTSSNAIYGNLITCRYALGSGLKLQTTTSGSCLYLDKSAIELKGAEFGASASVHVVLDGSFCFVRNNYTISGSAANHVLASTGSQFIYLGGVTVTLTGTPAFTNFVSATNDSVIRAIAVTFSGSATGGSYSVAANSVINTNGGGASYFPGNSAGSTATGGQYI